MKIGIITTSRADFGIYMPLIKQITDATDWEVVIYAGGMHVSEKFGFTFSEIEKIGVEAYKTSDCLNNLKSPLDYSIAMAKTSEEFARLLTETAVKPDILFVLGDRFEMFAAIVGVVPFKVRTAHLHGGEDSLGALDQKYRNAISSMSDIHFASTKKHSERVKEILGGDKGVYNVGALGIEALFSTKFLERREFEEKYGLRKDETFILSTVHPETIHDNNLELVNQFLGALDEINDKIILTLPNADSQGDLIREAILNYASGRGKEKMMCLENMGARNYFSAIKFCSMMIGNSSSGIIEAASLNKLVIDLGDRQKGRSCGENVHRVPFLKEDIIKKYEELKNMDESDYDNPYGNGDSSKKIVSILHELKQSE